MRQKSRRFLYGKIPVNASMKPAELEEYLTPAYITDGLTSAAIFRGRKARYKKAGNLVKHGLATQEPYFGASKKLAYCIAKQAKQHMRDLGEAICLANGYQ
ncbi:hypothetical protein AB6A40_005836 [Gnathostoma spinigerum]|uniref:Uncharacterized protein n=1 Tax=Gnathostoma spinigerum TaxID=75299 RepID=A0ABD6ER12_9BILA